MRHSDRISAPAITAVMGFATRLLADETIPQEIKDRIEMHREKFTDELLNAMERG